MNLVDRGLFHPAVTVGTLAILGAALITLARHLKEH